jgi:hypothetical protein
MPKIANRNQQVYTSGMHPRPAYSRIVAVRMIISAGDPVELVMVPIFGDRVWILGIKICIKVAATNPANINYLIFRIGGSGEADAAQVIDWERLLPLQDNTGAFHWWQFCDGCQCYEWEMDRLYTKNARRLAVLGYRTGAGATLVQVSFRISEG